MSQEPPLLRLEVPSAPGSVRVARHACAALADSLDLDHSTVDAVAIAVSEAVGDAVRRHRGQGGSIEIVASASGETLDFSVVDGAFDLTAEELSRRLIGAVTETFEVRERSRGGVELRLLFR